MENKGNTNSKAVQIASNTDLNNISFIQTAKDNIEDEAKTPMQESIQQHLVLARILDHITKIDFENEASKGEVAKLREQLYKETDLGVRRRLKVK